MAIFAKQIMAQNAFIEQLQSILIQVKNAIFGGERFQKNNGQVIDKGAHLPGFALDKNGLLRASRAEISGRFFADSMEAGPLLLSESTPVGMTRNFAVSETAQNIVNAVRQYGVFNASGSYGSISFNQIEFIHTYSVDTEIGHIIQGVTYEVYIHSNNSRTLIAKSIKRGITNIIAGGAYSESTNHSQRLSNSLIFSITLTGKTFKLLDLPLSMPAEAGIVFRKDNMDGSSQLLVKN